MHNLVYSHQRHRRQYQIHTQAGPTCFPLTLVLFLPLQISLHMTLIAINDLYVQFGIQSLLARLPSVDLVSQVPSAPSTHSQSPLTYSSPLITGFICSRQCVGATLRIVVADDVTETGSVPNYHRLVFYPLSIPFHLLLATCNPLHSLMTIYACSVCIRSSLTTSPNLDLGTRLSTPPANSPPSHPYPLVRDTLTECLPSGFIQHGQQYRIRASNFSAIGGMQSGVTRRAVQRLPLQLVQGKYFI